MAHRLQRPHAAGRCALCLHATPAPLAAAVDVLVCCAMGGPTTEGLIDRAAFEALGPGSIFVNVSRGSMVDEPALLDALRSRPIEGRRPRRLLERAGHRPALRRPPERRAAPHTASGTVETRKAMGQLVRDNLAAHFAGRPARHPVA